jgi:hypothetical protein
MGAIITVIKQKKEVQIQSQTGKNITMPGGNPGCEDSFFF